MAVASRARTCACGCGRAIPKTATARRKYATEKCGNRHRSRKWRREHSDPETEVRSDAKPLEAGRSFISTEESEDGRASARRGPGYEWLRDADIPEWREYVAGNLDRGELLALLEPIWPGHLPKLSGANLSRWAASYVEDQATGEARAEWKIDPQDLAALDGGYVPFVERFHPETEVRPFDLQWEREIDGVVGSAGQLLLLAPQRHGKTEFLARYCQRRITQDPNIRILWVGRTQELAEEAVGFVRQLLEDEDYCEAVLGPGERFQPSQRGRSWTDKKFTVAQRVGPKKSPTMRALGIGGTTSGRDADLIIIDDPQEREDFEDGATAGVKQRKWFFTTFLARKMPHTGIAYITSRKHPQDIPASIIEDHADDWRVITYRAHDEGCLTPESDKDKHVECVLWPTQRPYSHLMKQKRADELWFETNYQNNPTTEKLVLITADHVRDATSDRYSAGHFPPGSRLIAGFDPATRKENAAVLWAWNAREQKAYLVDAKMFPTGPMGLAQAMSEWHDRYHCIEWVTEINLAGGFLGDTQVKATKEALGIRVLSHYTDRSNKVDHDGGVTSMIQTVRSEDMPIVFPILDQSEASDGLRELVRQMLTYDGGFGARSKHASDDLVLAAWFPWWRVLKDLIGRSAAVKVEVVNNGFGRSYGWTG